MSAHGDRPESAEDVLEQLDRHQRELVSVALQSARMLVKGEYDEAELAKLDARAAELRALIRDAKGPRVWDDHDLAGARFISGG
jgi:DNA repair ATPase RecN